MNKKTFISFLIALALTTNAIPMAPRWDLDRITMEIVCTTQTHQRMIIIEDTHDPREDLTPLHQAVQFDDVEQIRTLIEQGANVNEQASDGDTPLHKAASYGHTKSVALLLEKDAKVNQKNNFGNTPFHFAALFSHKDCVEILLNNGAEINEQDNSGNTPLHLIALTGFKDSAELLLQKGANLEVKDTDGKTAKDLAQENGHEAIVKLIESYEIPDIKEPESDETVS